jgi:RNA-binding protein
MPAPAPNPKLSELKARAQRLEPIVKVGHAGVSEAFLRSLDEALAQHELVKIKFVAFKEEKKRLAPEIARQTNSELVMRVGNVAVYFRSKGDAGGVAANPVESIPPNAT